VWGGYLVARTLKGIIWDKKVDRMGRIYGMFWGENE
jgi:hypothetical protein